MFCCAFVCGHRLTSRKQQNEQYVAEVVSRMEVREAIEARARQLGARRGESTRHYQTALLQAHRTGVHTLCPTFVGLDAVPGSHSAYINPKVAERSNALLEWVPAVRLLPFRLQQFMPDVLQLGQQLPSGQHALPPSTLRWMLCVSTTVLSWQLR